MPALGRKSPEFFVSCEESAILSSCFEKIGDLKVSVAKGAFQSVAIDLIVKRKDDDSSIGVLHLCMAAFSMHFNEA